MWTPEKPAPVKLLIGILAADGDCRAAAVDAIGAAFGAIELESDVWPFDKTDYYEKETGRSILRQFVSLERLISPGRLAKIKHRTNRLEQKLARTLTASAARPVNLDPGYIGPAKLVLATTKNYSHRIYIGRRMYAEVTLIFHKHSWQATPFTYPDYKQRCYHEFFDKVRTRLLEQLKEIR